MVVRMDAMVVPAVGPIVVVSRTIPEVVTPIVIVVTRVPERAVVVVVVPTVVVDVIHVDVGIAVVPVGPIVVVSPIPVAPVVVAAVPVVVTAVEVVVTAVEVVVTAVPVVVTAVPVVVTAVPVVVTAVPVVVAVTVPIWSVPTASPTGSVAVVDNPWKRLNTAGPIATSDGRSIGLGRWPILPANVGPVWATDWPVSVDVRAVAIRIIAVADVTAETRSGLGRQLAVTP